MVRGVVPRRAVMNTHERDARLDERPVGFIFVGEKRSRTAIRRGYSWYDKRLCARTLAEALETCGVEPHHYTCINVFDDTGELDVHAVYKIREWSTQGWVIVGLGRTVQQVLTHACIPYRAMIHPAARGPVRRREVYQAHVAEVLKESDHDQR
jgi:hypothetical protein